MRLTFFSYLTLGVLFFPLITGCEQPSRVAVEPRDDLHVIEKAFAENQSNLIVQSQGAVIRILSDDLTGSRHQRFILRLENGQTLLISHNIDIAPRIPELHIGDSVLFRGVYEWNEQGGLIHWTHRDPKGLSEGGWIQFQGKIFR